MERFRVQFGKLRPSHVAGESADKLHPSSLPNISAD
jgi:hypothetical protein